MSNRICIIVFLTNERAEYCLRISQLEVITAAGSMLEIGGKNNE
jgi:hypothetical protein